MPLNATGALKGALERGEVKKTIPLTSEDFCRRLMAAGLIPEGSLVDSIVIEARARTLVTMTVVFIPEADLTELLN